MNGLQMVQGRESLCVLQSLSMVLRHLSSKFKHLSLYLNISLISLDNQASCLHHQHPCQPHKLLTGLSTDAHPLQAGSGKSKYQLQVLLLLLHHSLDMNGEFTHTQEYPTKCKYQSRVLSP